MKKSLFALFVLVFVFTVQASDSVQVLKSSKLYVRHITVDGDGIDWPKKCDTLWFMAGDNSVNVISAWNWDSLFLLIHIWDKDLRFQKGDSLPAEFYDHLSLFLEPFRSRALSIQGNTRIFHLAPTDSFHRFPEGVQIAVKKEGTLNDGLQDAGWVVEVGLPWSALSRAPIPWDTLGMNVMVSDLDSASAEPALFSWGKEPTNPATWGGLVLTRFRPHSFHFFYTAIIVWFIFLFFVLSRKKKPAPKPTFTGQL